MEDSMNWRFIRKKGGHWRKVRNFCKITFVPFLVIRTMCLFCVIQENIFFIKSRRKRQSRINVGIFIYTINPLMDKLSVVPFSDCVNGPYTVLVTGFSVSGPTVRTVDLVVSEVGLFPRLIQTHLHIPRPSLTNTRPDLYKLNLISSRTRIDSPFIFRGLKYVWYMFEIHSTNTEY